MFGFLNTLVDLIVKTLEGLISFFAEIIPLLLKMLFAASPFVLIVATAFVLGGTWIGAATSFIVLVFIAIGYASARRSGISGSALTRRAIVFVLLADVLFGILIFRGNEWGSLIGETLNQKCKSRITTMNYIRAIQLGEELKLARANNSLEDIIRNIDALKATNSDYAIPLIIQNLKSYYPEADNNSANRIIALHCISALPKTNNRASCKLLGEIQAVSTSLAGYARDTASVICRE